MERFWKLLSARFIVVILTTMAFCYLSVTKDLTTEFTTIYIVIINYYFYKERTTKDKDNKEDN